MSSDSSQVSESAGVTTRAQLKPPGSNTKHGPLLKLNHYSSYLAQNKFRIINPASAGGNTSTTLRRPLQRLQPEEGQQNGAANNNFQLTSPNATMSTRPPPNSSAIGPAPQTVTKSSTRLPSRSSGLARPTPVRQTPSSAAGSPQDRSLASPSSIGGGGGLPRPATSNLRPQVKLAPSAISASGSTSTSTRLPSAAGGSSSKLATLRPPLQTKSVAVTPEAAAAPIRSALNVASTLEKPKALARVQISPSVRSPQLRQATSKGSSLVAPAPSCTPMSELRTSRTTRTTTSVVTSQLSQASFVTACERQSHGAPNTIDLSSVEDDVGQIRSLLEQLLPILVESHKTQEELAGENERLRNELAVMKCKLKVLKKASSFMSS